MTEEEKMAGYFSQEDIEGLSDSDFKTAIAGLISKGLLEEVMVDGKVCYRPAISLNSIRSITEHMDSDPNVRN